MIDYGIGAQILLDLGIKNMVLLSNSPTPKIVGLEGYGLNLVARRTIRRMKNPIHILVVEGRFYHHISDQLIAGAEMALREQGATWETVMVPGALEIPQVLSAAYRAGLYNDTAPTPFHGFVALGCVIRGETSHYDIVAGESARALMDLSIAHGIPLGNGILTVETEEQALARAAVSGKNKGRDAVEACLEVLRHKRDFAKRAQ